MFQNRKIFLKNMVTIKIEKLQLLKKCCFLINLNDVKKCFFKNDITFLDIECLLLK